MEEEIDDSGFKEFGSSGTSSVFRTVMDSSLHGSQPPSVMERSRMLSRTTTIKSFVPMTDEKKHVEAENDSSADTDELESSQLSEQGNPISLNPIVTTQLPPAKNNPSCPLASKPVSPTKRSAPRPSSTHIGPNPDQVSPSGVVVGVPSQRPTTNPNLFTRKPPVTSEPVKRSFSSLSGTTGGPVAKKPRLVDETDHMEITPLSNSTIHADSTGDRELTVQEKIELNRQKALERRRQKMLERGQNVEDL